MKSFKSFSHLLREMMAHPRARGGTEDLFCVFLHILNTNGAPSGARGYKRRKNKLHGTLRDCGYAATMNFLGPLHVN